MPDQLLAHAQPSRADGTFDHDRAGRPKVRRVHLRAHPPTTPQRPSGLLSDVEWAWATSAPRRWNTIVNKLHDRAEQVALTLARTGCVALEHDYRAGKILQPPRGWTPHPDLADQHATGKQARHAARRELRDRAEKLRDVLAGEWPGVAAALTAPATDPRLVWIVRAAEDLVADRSHDGPRAFVQHHANSTKAREDLPRLLTDAGFEPEALVLLGVNRNPYIGLGGPIRAHHDGRTLDWTGWPGPHDIRLPAHRAITLDVAPGTQALLIIENRQAAEAICDTHPDTAVIWCHGQPPDPLLELINQAASGVDNVLICPDADLGGIRIAARIDQHLLPGTHRVIVDIGAGGHDRGEPFSNPTRDRIAAIARRADAVGDFARSCLARGYAVEQEASARAALQPLL
ncbi:hypothetical protein ALI22I_07665 [Saccharothrix sp. ALI-22-I]|nr:hypothetical protein ALI22I_07665 [Saccharothrix sp. ALI-22-I]